MSTSADDETRAVLSDLSYAVSYEINQRKAQEEQWTPLTVLGIKKIDATSLFLRAAEIDATLIEGAESRIRLDGVEYSAEISGLRLADMTIRVNECKLDDVLKAELRLPIQGQLEEVEKFLFKSLIDTTGPIWQHPSTALANSLTEPLESRAANHNIKYILGAPGSGKTSHLVERAMAAAQLGGRVVIVSFTNAAADVIFERIGRKVASESSLTVTRHGATETALHLERRFACPRVTVAGSQREAIDANIAITTAYRAFFLAKSRMGTHSHVFVDEASTIPLALAWTSALLATESVELCGDPFQLGPIGQDDLESSTLRRAFKTSPFEVEGVMVAARTDTRIEVLQGQHRLPARLAAAATPPLYRSTSAPSGMSVAEPTSPWGEGSLLYIDTSGLNPIGEQVDGSRRNFVHAGLVKDCVAALLEQGEIGPDDLASSLLVITPYRVQRGAIRKVLNETGWFSPAQVRASVTTIHRAQGSERPFVILDVTDAPLSGQVEKSSIGRLWDGLGWQSEGARLLTTALTRASKQALVIMKRDLVAIPADPHSLEIKSLPRLNSMLERYGRPADVVLTSTKVKPAPSTSAP